MSTTDPGPRRAAPAGDVDTRTPEPWEVAESPRRPRNNGELALSTLLVLLGVSLVTTRSSRRAAPTTTTKDRDGEDEA